MTGIHSDQVVLGAGDTLYAAHDYFDGAVVTLGGGWRLWAPAAVVTGVLLLGVGAVRRRRTA